MNLNSRTNPSEMSDQQIKYELKDFSWEYVALADWARSDAQYQAGEVYLNERKLALELELELRIKAQSNTGLQPTAGTRPAKRTHRYWNCPQHIEGENNLSTSWENVDCPHCLVTGGQISPFDTSGS